jgi:uncharacterized protein (TIGR03118 family)
LVNPWGIAYGPDTFFWVANNGTSTVTLYDGNGAIQSAAVGGPVVLPRPEGVGTTAGEEEELPGPTGLVFNGGAGFPITVGNEIAPSRFIAATTGGTIIGWSADLDMRTGIVAVDNTATGAAYTGLAIATNGTSLMLYAADFANNKIDVYDENFMPATNLAANAFIDPSLPQGYSPFNIQAIDNRMYVAYALVSDEGPEEVPGPGNGFVSLFEANGAFVTRVLSQDLLNAPWAVVQAPADFGVFSGALLIGNFGDGRITALDPNGYGVLGQLESAAGQPIELEGLWGLVFGNGNLAGLTNELFFAAGIEDETHGLFGKITAL